LGFNIKVGQGIDFHQLVIDRPLILGGVHVPHHKGCLGHSDADVLLHAICDALLGAAALGDIGVHFPDTSNEFKGIDSKILLQRSVALVKQQGYSISNIDSTLCLQAPKIKPYLGQMIQAISQCTGLDGSCISIKATTTEQLGFVGREEGVFAQAVCLLYKA
jgi:2-C-methyl-D-erythritol 2,4-cyclodiphosphate synthase